MPFAVIPFLLLAIPVMEIAVFIVVGREIGVLATLAFVFVTAVIGSFLLRVQGLSVVSRIRDEMDAGRVPGRELVDGVMIVAAAILLLTPGFVTDTIGFLLFVPAVRGAVWRFLASRIDIQVAAGGVPGGDRRRGSGRVVDLDPDEFHEAGSEGRRSAERKVPPARGG